MSTSSDAEANLRALIDQHSMMRQGLTARLFAALRSLWRGTDNYDQSLVIAKAARSATLVGAAQRQQSLATIAYLNAVARQHGVTPQAAPPALEYPRQANALNVYQRPAEQFRYRMSLPPNELATPTPVAPPTLTPVDPVPLSPSGDSVEPSPVDDTAPVEARVIFDPTGDAETVAEARILGLTEQDMAMSVRDTASNWLHNQNDVAGWRRVIHPELARKTGMSCGLCIVASDRLYTREELLPLHGGCHCAVVPVYFGADMGSQLNQADLKRIYQAAGTSAASGLKRTRISVKDNGELGPVLVRAGDAFKSPEDVAKDRAGRVVEKSAFDLRASYAAQAATIQANLDRVRGGSGHSDPTTIAWQTTRLAELDKLLASA